jgi:hypothetical protein
LSLNDWMVCTAVASTVLWLRELSKLLGARRRSSERVEMAGIADNDRSPAKG